jgi:lipopolysaccharide export system permease protein
MQLMLRHMTLRLIGCLGAIGLVMALAGLLATAWPLIGLAVAGVISVPDMAFALALLLPSMLCGVVPLATAAAVAYVYEGWARGNELVALRAAGLPDRKLLVPGLAASGAALLFTASISLYLLPFSFRAFEDIRYGADFGAALGLLGDGYPQPIAPKVSLSFRRRVGARGLEGVTVRDGRFGDSIKFVFAERADLLQSAEKAARPALVLHHGSYRTLDATGEITPPVDFDELIFAVSDASGLPRAREWRGYYEEHVWRLLDPPPEVVADPGAREAWLAEGHRRIVLPLLCPSFAIFALGAVLASGHRRQGGARWRVLACVAGICAWYGLLVAVDAVAGRIPLVTLTYYGLAVLPGAAGILASVWGSSRARGGLLRPIARQLAPRVDGWRDP